MITRGYFIGEIVDSLGEIASQVSLRGKLGLTDLHVLTENFFKEVLNRLHGWSLINLNSERVNEPGLDLGDETDGVGVQITAERTSTKVNETLEKLSDEQIKAYPKIRILMIAGKQGSYTLKGELSKRASFTKDDIWGVDDLCRQCMALPVDELQSLYEYVRSELTRVRIDLEVPDADGKFPTSIADFAEGIPTANFSNLQKFNAALEDGGYGEDVAETLTRLETLASSLRKLPRITREYFAFMLERREIGRRPGLGRGDFLEVNADKLRRILRYSDAEGELRLLQAYDFVSFDEPSEPNECGYWRMSLPGLAQPRELIFFEFLQANAISLARPIIHCDFGQF